MIRTTLTAALALGPIGVPAMASENSGVCSQDPVVMVVDGVTNDREQMAIYGQALKESGLHQHAGSYYLNDPRPLRILEGNRDQNHVTLLINSLQSVQQLTSGALPYIGRKSSPSGTMQAITPLSFTGSLVVPTMADSTKAYCTLAWHKETLKRLDIAVPLTERPCAINQ